jgi:hypothetical protein
MGVHDAPESVFTFGQNMHLLDRSGINVNNKATRLTTGLIIEISFTPIRPRYMVLSFDQDQTTKTRTIPLGSVRIRNLSSIQIQF